MSGGAGWEWRQREYDQIPLERLRTSPPAPPRRYGEQLTGDDKCRAVGCTRDEDGVCTECGDDRREWTDDDNDNDEENEE